MDIGDKIFIIEQPSVGGKVVMETTIRKKYTGVLYDVLPHKGGGVRLTQEEVFKTMEDAEKALNKRS